MTDDRYQPVRPDQAGCRICGWRDDEHNWEGHTAEARQPTSADGYHPDACPCPWCDDRVYDEEA